MRRTAFILGVTLAVGIAAGIIADQVLNAQQEPVKTKVLLKTDLAGIAGKEAIVVLVEHAPGTKAGKHYHPGHEFAYILRGSVVLEPEGKPPVTIHAGEVVYFPPNQVHDATNPSKTAPLKVLVFQINEKGQPFLVPVK